MRKWIVCIGELYFGGLGTAFANQACIGWVMTKLRERAEEFTSLETAQSVAKAIGGTVYCV
jgi:hypothetical protein